MECDEPPASGDVSRSGRIRKKSSKLRDYQSPDDWEGQVPGGNPLNRKALRMESQTSSVDDPMVPLTPMTADAETGNVPNMSIYMSEKSSKNRVMMRDGTMQMKKPRKDKGRTRMTAYMLWARSVRHQLEDLDFAAKSQRLGELWANVPNSERLLWKRRVVTYNRNLAKQTAKEQAAAAAAAKASQVESAASNSKFLNKSRGSRATEGSSRRNARGGGGGGRQQQVNIPVGPNPINNIAAHLKLLGDSLSNIGESLEQHEHGQNSITGTVSVLLDSLLCSVVPLISLTTEIEGFGHRVEHMKETLQDTLDNIAFVMPGLPF